MKKTKFQLLIWTLYYIFLFSLLLFNSFRYLDSDFGWHLKIGEQISIEQAAPSVDYYNFTVSGAEWVDHEWLFNLALYHLYNTIGYVGINILFALLVVAILALLTWFSRKYFDLKKNYIVIMIIQFLGTMAMSSHLGVRMQEIALLFLLLEIIILEIYSRKKKPIILLWLTPLYVLWANLHGSYLIGLFIIFVWVAVKFIEIKLAKKIYGSNSAPPVLKLKELVQTLPFFFFAAVSTLATPYGIKLYTYLSDLRDNFYTKHIAEWLPAYFLPINYYKLIYASVLTTFYSLYIIEYWRAKKDKIKKITPINLFYFSITIIFLILSFKSKRHFPLLFIVSFPILANQIKHFFDLPSHYKKYFVNNPLLKFFIVSGMILPIIYLPLITNFNTQPFSNPLYCWAYPCAALEFINDNDQFKDLTLFNTYGWGGYLMWNWPGKQLFIDGRMPQYRLGEQTLLQEYYNFFDPEQTADKLAEYNIEMILIRLNFDIKLNWFEKYIMGIKQNEEKENAFINHLDSSPSWHEVYNDNITVIYVK